MVAESCEQTQIEGHMALYETALKYSGILNLGLPSVTFLDSTEFFISMVLDSKCLK